MEIFPVEETDICGVTEEGYKSVNIAFQEQRNNYKFLCSKILN
jgi:hypothetical protein